MSLPSLTLSRGSDQDCKKNALWTSYKNKEKCDFTIKVGDEAMKCHRMILAAASAYFRNVFSISEATELVMKWDDIDDHSSSSWSMDKVLCVRILLDYLYGQQPTVSHMDQALELCDIATLWQLEDEFMESIVQIVVTAPTLTPDNCLLVRDRLIGHNSYKHAVALVDQFINEHFLEVVRSDSFISADIRYVLQLLDSDLLNVQDEMNVYHSALRWINVNRRGRTKYTSDIMMTVRMGLLNMTDLAMMTLTLGNYGNELNDYIRENIEYLQNKNRKTLKKGKMKSATRREGYITKTIMLLCGSTYNSMDIVSTTVSNGESWSPGPQMKNQRNFFGAVVCSGYVFVIGGSYGKLLVSCEKFSISAKEWRKVTDLPEPRTEHSASCIGKTIYVSGGYMSGFDPSSATDTVITLDVGQGQIKEKWSPAISMSKDRKGHVSCCLNGILYVIGGSVSSCEKFDPMTNVWTPIACSKHQHWFGGLCTDDVRRIYVAGDMETVHRSCVEVYDTNLDQWTVLPDPMSTARWGSTLSYCDGSLIVVGGMDENKELIDKVEILNLMTNRWSFTAAPLPAPRCFHCAVCI